MNKAKTVAFLGVMSALVFVALFLETYVFTILIPLAPPCFISISVAITISVYDDWKKSFVGGTILGCCSLIIAFIIGNPIFIFPWISVLPRVFVGIVAYWVIVLVRKICGKCKNKFVTKYLPYGIGAIFGVITNTVLTCLMMFVCGHVGIEIVVASFMAINFPLEVVCSAILVPLLVNALHRFIKPKRTLASKAIETKVETVEASQESTEDKTENAESADKE